MSAAMGSTINSNSPFKISLQRNGEDDFQQSMRVNNSTLGNKNTAKLLPMVKPIGSPEHQKRKQY